MTEDRWPEVRRILEQVLDMPPSVRLRFVAEASGGDLDLRKRLEHLLACEAEVGSVADVLARSGAECLPAALFPPGSRLGSCRITHVIGTGGMGTVFEAVQEHPHRTVAIKVIRPDLSSTSTLRRFAREIEVLGRLAHPGIARIYEAGTAVTAIGEQPFFAMEFVRGESITQHVRARSLPRRERLRLLVSVCAAVQHAHDQGVVHRDIKPGNILVDDHGEPKVLDFGVARVIDAERQTSTLATGVGELVGTLAYMSPEQVAGDLRQVDARSDVYALGVIAYEMLTGRLPLAVIDKPLPEAARMIRDDEPPLPSTLDRTLRGDLETILLKALEKDRMRRYPSAASFAQDLERFLRDQPISARPANTFYQLSKFARRNKALCGGLSAVFVITLISAVVAWVLLVRERKQETIARWQAYIANIAAAEAAIRAYDVVNARRRLESVPEPMRAWEWRHLFLRLDRSLTTIRGAEIGPGHVAWSPAHDLLASTSHDGTVRLWDPIRGREIQRLGQHDDRPQSLAFSPDGSLLASASQDNVVKLWDVASGGAVAMPNAGAGLGSYVAWSPDGRSLYLQKTNGMIRRWIVDRGATVTLIDDGQPVEGLVACDFALMRLSADGSHLATCCADELRIWDLETRRVVTTLHLERPNPNCIALHPRETVAAVDSGSGRIRLWNWFSNCWREFDSPEGHVKWLVFNRDGSRLYSAGHGAAVRAWNAATLECDAVLLGHEHDVQHVALNGDETRIASSTEGEGAVKVWDAAATDIRILRGHVGFVMGVAFSPDGRLLASTGAEYPEADSAVRVWDVRSGQQVRVLRGHDERFRVRPVAFSRDGTTLVSGGGDRTVRFWDVESGEQRACLKVDGEVRALTFSPDGKRLVVTLVPRRGTSLTAADPSPGTERAIVVDVAALAIVTTLQGDAGLAGGVSFSPDGRFIVVTSEAGTMHWWDATTFATVTVLECGGGDLFAAVFSPDGLLLAVAGGDSTVRLWDVRRRREIHVLHGHSGEVRDVAFSPDGKRLASVSLDRTLCLWDVGTCQLVATLHGHTAQLFAVKFSPDGNTIATASNDCTVRLWESQ